MHNEEAAEKNHEKIVKRIFNFIFFVVAAFAHSREVAKKNEMKTQLMQSLF